MSLHLALEAKKKYILLPAWMTRPTEHCGAVFPLAYSRVFVEGVLLYLVAHTVVFIVWVKWHWPANGLQRAAGGQY